VLWGLGLACFKKLSFVLVIYDEGTLSFASTAALYFFLKDEPFGNNYARQAA